KRQIRRNYLTNRHFFGDVYSPRGFFPPEMCYSDSIIEPLLEARHEWIILSGVACPVSWPTSLIHQIPHGLDRVAVFFRDDILSNKISFQGIDGGGFIEHLKGLRNENGDIYVITAMDAETFGHHIQNWERLFLAEVYEALSVTSNPYLGLKQQELLSEEHKGLFSEAEKREIEIVTLSQLLDIFPKGDFVQPRPSSWSTTEDDLKNGNYYPLWRGPSNILHKMQWEHSEICIGLVRKALEVADNDHSRRFAEIARGLLDPALHSCQFWWASKTPMWDINMIHRGLIEQQEVIVNAYKAVHGSGCNPGEKKEQYYRVLAARNLRAKITDMLFFE
ncbi:MAG: hypothetical protein HYX82_00745, partial [Chloroflexi bacterium]|nr:hypothetical protein [Chloroflexota bacterium]